ncbi:MAG: xanthine dehydrogenase family protein subunit M [Streptosporangiales bacterium]|nr:xanthine dehydrogenase family protein subunit M [Streptosporangiales bacterium]MBO0890109.1 xanthine dehydrogenase family protein subunit M [Acidothermales bacterium]
MKPIDFDLHRPETLDEALDLLAEHGDDGKVLAGGQSLLPLLNFRLARPAHLVDVGRVASLAVLRRTATGVTVGAMVRQASAEQSPAVASHCPLLAAALPNIAHPPIRNRGTLGGSLAHGDPAAELPSVATALDAVFVAASIRGRREIPAAEFFRTHLVTALEPDELLTEIRFPATDSGTGAAFAEVGRRRGDFALVGVAAQVTVADGRVTDARVCLSGVADTPSRPKDVEDMLRGTAADDDVVRDAANAVRETVEPVGDLHATADYRRHVAGVLLARALREAYETAERSEDGHDLRIA